MKTENNRIEAFSLVERAIQLQLSEDSEPEEIERCLRKAFELDPESIEVLEEAAHFYDAVMPIPMKAREYATLCRVRAAKLLAEMDEILAESE